MVVNLMADLGSESYVQSDTFGLRQISSSIFGIPAFLVGLSSKGPPDLDSVKSPTSPLDFRVFANLSNRFGVKSPRSTSQNGHQMKWNGSEVGLGIINSLVEESKSSGEVLESLKRKNVIFGPQVKANNPKSSSHYHDSVKPSVKCSSLPRNYMISTASQTETPNIRLGRSNGVCEHEGFPLEPESLNSSPPCLLDSTRFSSPRICSSQSSNMHSKAFYSTDQTTTISAPLVNDRSSLVDISLGPKSNSLPIPIASGNRYVGSLSAHEIELSEDYTCIISHGPNRKTTHIFGDCVVECQTHELANFDKEEQQIQLPEDTRCLKDLTPYPSDEFLSFSYSCNKKLEKGEDIYMYRGEKAFCSFDCRLEEIFAEEEIEKSHSNSSKSSPRSSYHEDLFVMGMPMT
ncbi:FCS-Like Zinc finger 10-like [Mangifera indica]|uniref:FCS-Like Zinc finger 10-like n=1 Tax=Mangifera indica TaxID=29780 RepID=UPI001CFB1824|nr:FCS-Like Zinc finger 10-like [Mangifera indica]